MGSDQVSKKRWVPLVVICGLPLVLLWKLILGGRVLYWGTPVLQFYPWRRVAVEMMRAGAVPLWNHYVGNGTPLAANLQSAVFYPLNLIYLLVPVERAMGYSVVVHVALAGLFMYLYARSVGLGRFAGLVAALSYMFSGFLLSRLGFLSMANAVPWLPLFFFLAERLVRQCSPVRVLLLGAALGLGLLAGHVQLWYYGLWALGWYVLYRSWRRDKPLHFRFRIWLFFALAVLVGLAAAAIQVLPTLELTRLSQRSSGAEYDFAMTYSFWPWRLITLLAPDFFGHPAHGDYWGYGNYWEDCGYIGLLPLIFALGAVVFWARSRRQPGGPPLAPGLLSLIPFFALLCLVSLLLAMGENLPLYPLLFRWGPGFGLFQAPARFLYLYTLGAALLAGVGAELFLVRPPVGPSRVRRYTIVVGLAVLLAAVIARFLLPAVKVTFIDALGRFALTLIISVGLLSLRGWMARETAQIERWQTLVVAFIAVDLMLFGYELNPTTGPELYRATTASGAFLREDPEPFRTFAFEAPDPRESFAYRVKFDRYFSFEDFGSEEVEHLLGLRETLIPNLGVLENIYSASNDDPLQVGRYLDLMEAIGEAPPPLALRLLGLMNVRYILNDRAVADLAPVFVDGDRVHIYRHDRALPRAYVVSQARIVPDSRELLSELMGSAFDPGREVLLEKVPGTSESARHLLEETGQPVAEVRSLHYSPNRVKIEVSLEQDGYLVLSDTFYPGWRAYVDGREVEILRANYAFKAVPLQAGSHAVLFEYRPLSFQVGLLVSLAAWGIIAAGGFIWRKVAS